MLNLMTSFTKKFQITTLIVVMIVVLVMNAPITPRSRREVFRASLTIANAVFNLSAKRLIRVRSVFVVPAALTTRHAALGALLTNFGLGVTATKITTTTDAYTFVH